MLGPIGSNLMSLLRMLTPSEIDRYTELKQAKSLKAKVAIGGEAIDLNTVNIAGQELPDKEAQTRELPDNQAEIIPFDEEERKKEKKRRQEEQARQQANSNIGQQVQEEDDDNEDNLDSETVFTTGRTSSNSGSDLEKMGIYSREKQEAMNLEKVQKKKSKEDSASVFLLKQREGLKESVHQMRIKEAMGNYKKLNNKNHLITIAPDEDSEEDLPVNNANTGILVNKKQA